MQRQFSILLGLSVVAATWGAASTATADMVLGTDGDFQFGMTDPVAVGSVENLYSVTLYVENTASTDFQMWPNGFSGQIGGTLHHDQFQFAPPAVIPTPTAATFGMFGGSPSSIDSHFLLAPAVTVTAPSEPGIDPLTSGEPTELAAGATGFGGPLAADVAFFNATNPPGSARMDFAQIVMANGTSFDYQFQAGTGTIGLGGAFGGSACVGPDCGGGVFPPNVDDLMYSSVIPQELIELMPMDTGTGDPATWSELTGPTYTPMFGAPDPPTHGTPAIDAIWDAAMQKFSWDTTSSARGRYVWEGTAMNGDGTDPFSITVDKTIPEPASVTLLGLALIGLVGLARRRS